MNWYRHGAVVRGAGLILLGTLLAFAVLGPAALIIPAAIALTAAGMAARDRRSARR